MIHDFGLVCRISGLICLKLAAVCALSSAHYNVHFKWRAVVPRV